MNNTLYQRSMILSEISRVRTLVEFYKLRPYGTGVAAGMQKTIIEAQHILNDDLESRYSEIYEELKKFK